MTRRDWYIGVAAVVVAVLMHAAVPRYEWREGRVVRGVQKMTRIDRWTGAVIEVDVSGQSFFTRFQ